MWVSEADEQLESMFDRLYFMDKKIRSLQKHAEFLGDSIDLSFWDLIEENKNEK